MQSAKRKTQNTIRCYLQPAFLICVAVLVISGSGMSMVVKKFGVYLKKEPMPLRKTLELLDENGLGPYKVLMKSRIENEDIVESLGTEDYIQWYLEDSEQPVDSAVRRCLLFITYYELPDMVPHVPEECYTGGGYQRVAADNVVFKIEDGINRKIPGRYLVFSGAESNYWTSGIKFPVLYLINVNREYAGSREEARLALNKNIFGKYSYFCKVEWKFFNEKFGSTIYPKKQEAIAASQKLLSVILPVLETEHWPQLETTPDLEISHELHE